LAIAMKIGWSVYKILNLAYPEPGIGGRLESPLTCPW